MLRFRSLYGGSAAELNALDSSVHVGSALPGSCFLYILQRFTIHVSTLLDLSLFF